MRKLNITLAAACAAGLGVASAQEPAEPVVLDEADMDAVSAGVLDDLRLAIAVPVSVVNAVDLTSAIGILSENIAADGGVDAQSANLTGLDLGNFFDLGGLTGGTGMEGAAGAQ